MVDATQPSIIKAARQPLPQLYKEELSEEDNPPHGSPMKWSLARRQRSMTLIRDERMFAPQQI